MKKLFLTVLLTSLIISLFSAPAFAIPFSSQAQATAEFDWSAMTITGTGSISWTAKSTYTDALASNISGTTSVQTDSGADWAAHSITATLGDATATGSAGADGSSGAKLNATSDTGPPAHVVPFSEARAERYGTFAYSGTGGLVTISIPYTLSYALDAGSDPPDYAYGMSIVFAEFTRTHPGYPTVPEGEVVFISELASNGQYLSESKIDTVVLSLNFLTGDTGTIAFGTYAQTDAYAIPIPGALWLFGAGLIGLIGAKRRLS